MELTQDFLWLKTLRKSKKNRRQEMEIEGILKQKYITAKDLQKIIPGIGYVSALKLIE